MTTKIQRVIARNGTKAEWDAAVLQATEGSTQLVLAQGEISYETDTSIFRIGDGQTAFEDLPRLRPVQKFDTRGEAIAGDVKEGETLSFYDGDTLIEMVPSAQNVAMTLANGRTFTPAAPNILPQAYGIDRTGVQDMTDELNDYFANPKRSELPAGTIVRANGPLSVPEGKSIQGEYGEVEIRQGGDVLFAMEDVEYVKIQGITCRMARVGGATAVTGRDRLMRLGGHRHCVFKDIAAIGYSDCGIIDRKLHKDSQIPITFNEYSFDAVGCLTFGTHFGYDPYHVTLQGDGVKTVFDVDKVWPERFPSSLLTIKERADGVFEQIAFTGVTYDVQGKPSVTLGEVLPGNSYLHVFPSIPINEGHIPISNNKWIRNNADYVFRRGHTFLRWTDAEAFYFDRLLASADSVVLYDINPYSLGRNGQGGDHFYFNNCYFSYRTGSVPNPGTLRGVRGYGGTFALSLDECSADFGWSTSGPNRVLELVDGTYKTIPGTVLPNGTTTLAGEGTEFTKFLSRVCIIPDPENPGSTIVAGNADDIELGNGEVYSVAEIVDDTTLILGAPATAGPATTIRRRNFQERVDARFSLKRVGAQDDGNILGMRASGEINSALKRQGVAVITAGAKFVEVRHRLMRMPREGEVVAWANQALGDNNTVWVGAENPTTFRININYVEGADVRFTWKAELTEIN